MFRAPRFYLGQTVITPRARKALTQEEVIAALGCHVIGDWGELTPPLREANERAVDEHMPVISAYRSTATGTKFYVFTTADRSSTTVLLPDEVK